MSRAHTSCMSVLAKKSIKHAEDAASSGWHAAAMAQLIDVVQRLSHARTVDAISAIVREAARNLTGADGASFVLRENDQCFYADENAIAPLWKGRRFPLQACVSGWVMLNAQPAIIPDIYADPRVPVDAYRPTFVKSMVMVPIRRDAPIGAIGNYWAKKRSPITEEIAILQALADTTSVALENAALYTDLQKKVQALEESNHELGGFAWVASHDLQEPLRVIATQMELLDLNNHDRLDEEALHYIHTARAGAQRLRNLIESLLVHARAAKPENLRAVDLEDVFQKAVDGLRKEIEESGATILAPTLPMVSGDGELLERLLLNLLSNAIKFRRKQETPEVQLTCQHLEKEWLITVKDNGIGIVKKYLGGIFDSFHRLNSPELYPGSGLSLALCKKIVTLHGGRIWMKSEPGVGTTVFFTLRETGPA